MSGNGSSTTSRVSGNSRFFSLLRAPVNGSRTRLFLAKVISSIRGVCTFSFPSSSILRFSFHFFQNLPRLVSLFTLRLKFFELLSLSFSDF